MYFLFGLWVFSFFLIVTFIILARRHMAKLAKTQNEFKTFRELNGIEDYEKEAKRAMYEVTRCKTLFEKMSCYVKLSKIFDSLYWDYEKNEKLNPLLMEVLYHKFTFTYSAFVTAYLEPIEENGLERFSLINTKKYCPEYVWKHIMEASIYADDDLDDYFVTNELDPLKKMQSDISLYNGLMRAVLYGDVTGCYVYEENGRSEILDNKIYTVTEEQLNQWLDEELAFISYLTESLLNICIEYIRTDMGIIRL